MKKSLVWLLVGMMVFVFVGCSSPEAPPPSEPAENGEDETIDFSPVTLRMAEQTPPVGIRAEVLQWFADEVHDRTEGRVTIDIHWDSTLLEREEMIRGVMTGAADMGSTNVAFHPSELHTWGVFNTFLTGPESLEDQQELKRRVFEEIPAFNSELERWNQMWVFSFSYQPGMLGCRNPLESIYDMEGQQMRAPSRWLLAMLEAAGATPVSLGWAEVYTSLDRGTIDGVYTSVDSFERYAIEEVSPYFLWHESLWMPQPFLFTINLDTWNSLLEQDRDIIWQVGQEAEEMGVDMNDADVQRGIDAMLERTDGVVVNRMDIEEVEWWNDLPEVQELPDIWAEESEEKGIPGEEIVARVRELRGEYMDF